jgi:alkylation response protein AidB-like acyl-CoA dehydrogenase
LDFNPCMKHQLIRKTVREFAEREIKPHVADLDRDARFPWDIVADANQACLGIIRALKERIRD